MHEAAPTRESAQWPSVGLLARITLLPHTDDLARFTADILRHCAACRKNAVCNLWVVRQQAAL